MSKVRAFKFRKTSSFGDWEQFRNIPHNGVDISMPEGTPIQALNNGIIERVIDYGNTNAGKTIIMKLDNGYKVVYGHLSEFKVKQGQIVSKGDLIALSGNTGNSTGPHLHLGVRDKMGNFIDPEKWYNEELYSSTSLMDKINEWSEIIVRKELDFIFKPVNNFIIGKLEAIYYAFYNHLPEIGGIATLLIGLYIMFTGKTKRLIPYGVFMFALVSLILLGG